MAIGSRGLLRFHYELGDRIIEPCGVSDGGRELRRRYQWAGLGHSREEGRMLAHVEEMQGIGVLQDAFEALRLDYMRSDPSVTKICAEL